jgi:hypothetical protein
MSVSETKLENNWELLIMSRCGCIGDADQVRRPAVKLNERTSSVENPTFDALYGLDEAASPRDGGAASMACAHWEPHEAG